MHEEKPTCRSNGCTPVVIHDVPPRGEKDDYDEGWDDGYQLRRQESHADLREHRRQVTLALGPGFLCHACGRPIDEAGCQYRRYGGFFMDTKVHLISPAQLARDFGLAPVPLDVVGDAEFRERRGGEA